MKLIIFFFAFILVSKILPAKQAIDASHNQVQIETVFHTQAPEGTYQIGKLGKTKINKSDQRKIDDDREKEARVTRIVTVILGILSLAIIYFWPFSIWSWIITLYILTGLFCAFAITFFNENMALL